MTCPIKHALDQCQLALGRVQQRQPQAGYTFTAAYEAISAARAELARRTAIRIDFKQTTDLLEMFGDEPGEVQIILGDGHSGHGLYAIWSADPEGTIYLGETDEDALPESHL